MKSKNRLPLLLATLLLLCLGGMAGIITYLEWQSDLLMDEADRTLSRLEEMYGLSVGDNLPSESVAEADSEEQSSDASETGSPFRKGPSDDKESSPDREAASEGSAASGKDIQKDSQKDAQKDIQSEGESSGEKPSAQSKLTVHGSIMASAAAGVFSTNTGTTGRTGKIQGSDEAISEADMKDIKDLADMAEEEGAPPEVWLALTYGEKDKVRKAGMTPYFTERELAAVSAMDHHVIFVGDSRTVGMGHAEQKTGDGCIYIGESGEGYNWLIEHGIEQLDEAIRAYPDSPVVFNFGVNDCESIYSYIDVYRELEKGYPDTSFYYMSVNPVTEESVNVPLSNVLAFNNVLQATFPDQYIDTCSWMLTGGFEDVDGVHYSQAQYRKIHDYAVLSIETMSQGDGSAVSSQST